MPVCLTKLTLMQVCVMHKSLKSLKQRYEFVHLSTYCKMAERKAGEIQVSLIIMLNHSVCMNTIPVVQENVCMLYVRIQSQVEATYSFFV